MQTLGGLLAFPYLAVLAYLGYAGYPWWWVLAAAIAGLILYLMIRPYHLLVDWQRQRYHAPLTYYAFQCVTAAIPLGIIYMTPLTRVGESSTLASSTTELSQ